MTVLNFMTTKRENLKAGYEKQVKTSCFTAINKSAGRTAEVILAEINALEGLNVAERFEVNGIGFERASF